MKVASLALFFPSVSAAQSKLLLEDTIENVTTLIDSGQQKKKIIRVKSQADEWASVSAAQGKLLHKETTEMLQN